MKREFLTRLNLPVEDNHALEPSSKHFKDGGDYRFEIPSVEGPRVFREVLEAAKELKVPIHRVSQGSGIMLLSKDEIREMARMGAGERIEVCLFVGPRATFETGAQTASTAGKVIGLQHRGADQLVYAIEDVRRACALGIRSVLPADLGLIWVLKEMKEAGELPKNLIIKSSVTLPAANPATAMLFERAGVSPEYSHRLDPCPDGLHPTGRGYSYRPLHRSAGQFRRLRALLRNTSNPARGRARLLQVRAAQRAGYLSLRQASRGSRR